MRILSKFVLIFAFTIQLFAQEELQLGVSTGPVDFTFDREGEPSCIVHGCINVLTGACLESGNEITVNGPVPLNFSHYYNSRLERYTGDFGHGYCIGHPFYTQKILTTSDPLWKTSVVCIEESGGSFIRYFSKDGQNYYTDVTLPNYGLTNSGNGTLSGKTNVKNIQVRASIVKNETTPLTLTLGDGTKRIYSEKMLLNYEILPDGNKIFYEFDQFNRPTKIYSTNSAKSIVYNWITFAYNKETTQLTGSNGKTATYNFSRKKGDVSWKIPGGTESKPYNIRRLDSIQSSSKSSKTYKYDRFSDRVSCEIARVIKPEGRCLGVGYEDHRVKSLSTPYGTIYTFKLNKTKRRNTVRDAFGAKTTYHYTKEKWLDRVVRYCKNSEDIYSSQRFLWTKCNDDTSIGKPVTDQGGYLKVKGLSDSKNNLIRATHYTYDNRGNVLQESILGNLSGEVPNVSIILDKNHMPIKGKYEVYTREKTYSNDGFNNLLSEKEENGLYTTYSYLPGTDRVASKFVYDNGKLSIRNFYEYDQYRILIKQIIDNGSTTDIKNLSGVTERKITSITPKYDHPGFGQPKSIQESYIDISSGKEVLLGRKDYKYNKSDLIIQEDTFDADLNYRFSIYKDYDDHDNVVKQTDALGVITLFSFDANDNKISEERLGSGFKTVYTYDLCDRLIAQEEIYSDQSFKVTYAYDLMGRKISSVDTYGNETKYFYDIYGRENKIIYPAIQLADGKVIHPTELKEYDISDNIISFTDKNGSVTLTEYNSSGKPTKITYPDGSKERIEYLTNGLTLNKWSRSGGRTSYIYDAFGRVLREDIYDEKNQIISSQHFEYNAFHLLKAYDKMGNCTEYQYDGSGRKIAEIKCNVEKKTYSYDSLGRPLATLTWHSENEYSSQIQILDVLDRVIEKRCEDQTGKIYQKELYDYDINGNQIEVTTYLNSSQKAITQKLYNALNEITERTDALGNTSSFIYDHNFINQLGQKVLQKTTLDPLNSRIIETSDVMGNTISMETQNPLGDRIAYTEYCYDAKGNETLQKHLNIVDYIPISEYIIVSTYDSMGQLISQKEMDKETQRIYDLAGRLETLIKPDGIKLSHTYNSLGYLLSLTSSDNSINYTYDYDLNGNLIQEYDNGKITGIFTYNNLNLLEAEQLGNSLKLEYLYTPSGRLQQVTLPDNSSLKYIYNPVDLFQIERYNPQGEKLYSHTYQEHDWEGKPLKVDLIGNAGKLFNTYDLLGRQIEIRTNVFTETIPENSFDAVGNLRKINLHDPIGNLNLNYEYDELYQLAKELNYKYSYDSLFNRLQCNDDTYKITPLNQVASTNSTNYTYDLNGNLIQANDITYTYDALNRLIKVNNDVQYTYDSKGRRLSKIESGITTNFLYQMQCEIGSYSPDQSTLRILGKGRELEVQASVAIETNNNVYAPIHDHRGNICVLINSFSGAPEETLRYTSFGETEIFGPPLTPWQFASKRFDSETGFTFFTNRYYIPTLGKWLTPDPLGFSDGPNLYAYVRNQPQTLFDPYGLFGWDDTWSSLKGCGSGAYSYAKEIGHGAYHSMGRMGEWMYADFQYEHCGDPSAFYAKSQSASDEWNAFGSALKNDSYGTLLPHVAYATRLSTDASVFEKAEAWTKCVLDVALTATALTKTVQGINTISKAGRLSVLPEIAEQSIVKQGLTRSSIKSYLANTESLTKAQIMADAESIGLTLKGKVRNRAFMDFEDKSGKIRLKIHPPDNQTKYHHIHIYNLQGKSLDKYLKPVSRRTADAHIPYGGNS